MDDLAIKKLLRENTVDGIFHTHVSLIKPKGKFQFNRQTLENFWDLYCTYISIDENPTIGIAEKAQQYLPVLVDVDLKIRSDENEINLSDSLYNEEQLKTVVQTYQSVLRKIVDNCTDSDLTCVVLEKNMYQLNKNDITYLKHGFHLHFPYCFLNKVDQEVHLIPRVKEVLKHLKLFENLRIDDSGDVIDKACCKVPWLLYGSKKTEESEPYKVSKIYNSEMNKIDLDEAFEKYTIFDHKEQSINIKGNIDFFLPRILSIIPYGRNTKEVKRGLISPIKEQMRIKQRVSSTQYEKQTVDAALNEARKLLPLLADYRTEDRNEWMTVGWVLFNISEGSSEGLDLWCEFSSRCEDKYDESSCIYEWERMTKKDMTIGTLKHYASVDSPEQYKKYKEEQCHRHILASLDGSHNDVAKALYEEFGDQFVCASVENETWYQFSNHRWEKIEKGVFLRIKISESIVLKYIEAVKNLYGEIAGCQDKAREAMINVKIKQIQKMIGNLKSCNYKNAVMREAMEVFYNPKFKDRLDADPYLVCFQNGVYDLKLNVFRKGRPEDYLSKTMPINYVEFSEDDDRVQQVKTFLEQVFPDKSVRKYFLDSVSDIFVGGNHEKVVQFWLGEGDNGKSVTQKIFESMFGKLAIKLNTNIITGKKPSAGNSFADLARTGGGVRWAVLEEPDGDECINVGTFKHLSGNDTFYARDLYEKGKDTREISPMFKLVFICNKLPRIRHADKAFWNRVRVIPFESTFCRADNPPPESYEEQLKEKRFPMDKQFDKKIPKLLEPLAWLLLEHRKKVTVRTEPEKVRTATEIYKRQNDIYKQFLEETIVEDDKKVITLTELYSLFKEWYKESLPGHTVPVKNEIEEYFVKLWGIPELGKKWKGYRQRTLKDDIDNGDAFVLSSDDLVDYSNLPKM